uniref:Uncharacterized protein n=1 Tax=Apteryx owenii TaxID=8824 RepID=A0A8B9S5Z7_APTOW
MDKTGIWAQAASIAHPEVLGVHVQLLAVQLGQLGVGCLNVVQVLHGFPKGGEHFPAMGTDLGVANDGGGTGEVPKGGEEPLGPRVDDEWDQEPNLPGQGLGTTFLHIDLAPDAGDELLLLGCPVHHGGEAALLRAAGGHRPSHAGHRPVLQWLPGPGGWKPLVLGGRYPKWEPR